MSNPNVSTVAPPEVSQDDELVAAVIGLDQNVHAFAREAANDRLHESIHSGNKLARFAKRIWQGNLARDFYLNRYTQEARSDIESSQNLYAHEKLGNTDQAAHTMRQAVTERFVSEYDETIREGETKQELGDTGPEVEFKGVIKDLIARFARGELDETNFEQEKMRAIHGAVSENQAADYIGKGEIYADNLLEIARQVKARCDHADGEAGIEQLLANMKFVAGEARVGASTEIRKNTVDKIVEKSSGLFINETTVGIAAAIVMSATKWGARTALGAAAKALLPGAGTGAIAGFRENSRFKEERSLQARDSALGRLTGGGKRREQLQEAIYEAKSTAEVLDSLRSMHQENSTELKDNFSEHDFHNAMALVGDAMARIQVSDREGMDLLRFSSVEASEAERTSMMIQLCASKVKLREWLAGQTDDERRRIAGDQSDDFSALTTSYKEAAELLFSDEISDKDDLFKKMKRNHVARAVLIGSTVGAVIGLGAQEAVASFDDSTQGMIEHLWQDHDASQHVQHESFLEGAFNHQSTTTVHEAISLVGHNQTIQPNHGLGQLKLDSAFKVDHSDHGYSIAAPGGGKVDGITFNPNGTLTAESQHLLNSNHFSLQERSFGVGEHTSKTVNVTPKDLIANHKGEFTHVTRDGWFDNDTKKFDLNELKTHWGGVNGTGIDSEGNYVLDVSHMTPDGSFHAGVTANWHEIAAQKDFKLAVSLSGDTQNNVIMLDINPNGQVVIPHDSVALKGFSTENGHAVFSGKYAEVSQVTRIDGQNITHIKPLSTVVGEGITKTPDVVTTTETVIHHNYELQYHQPAVVEVGPDILVPPIIPILARESLSPWRRRENGGYGYYDGYLSPEARRQQEEETSPRLRRDPEADLNPREELNFFNKLLRKKKGREYVNSIEDAIEASPELNTLPEKTKLIVTIPVGAEYEADNIYRTLARYAKEDPAALTESTILLHVNWFDTNKDGGNDPTRQEKINRTRSEIERARADFPELRIASFETEWKREEYLDEAGNTLPIIGFAGRKLSETALIAVQRAMANGQISNDQDVLLVRNDADPKGMSAGYLSKMLKAAQEHQQTDVFTGTTRFDQSRATDLPGFVKAANFMQSLGVLASVREGHVHTAGANFGVRASILAAVGGSGFDREATGAGSDDVAIGSRIQNARRVGYSSRSKRQGGRSKRYLGRSLRSGYSSGDGDTGVASTGRRVGRRISGAQIDTDSAREEAEYRQGVPIAGTWDGNKFDGTSGYNARDANLNGASTDKEDLRNNPEAVIEHLRRDMEASTNIGWASDAVNRTALAMVFNNLPRGSSSSDAYELTYSYGRNGRRVSKLKFTNLGRQLLLNQFTRDSKGRFDMYGNRLMRQVYGQVKPGARRQATHAAFIPA